MALSSVLTAVFLLGALGLAVRRLPGVHPVTLWCASWAVVGTLFALDLLPYKPLGALTALLICGATVAFAMGALYGERRGINWIRSRRSHGPSARISTVAIERAALTACAVAAAMLAAFIAQTASTYGLRDTLLVSADVRIGLGAGASSATIKYLYPAIAGVALCSLAAARQQTVKRRRVWLLLSAASVGSIYFATGRVTIVIAAAIALLAYWLGRGALPPARRLVAGGVVLAALALTTMLIIGELQGKTFGNSALQAVPSPFTEHEALEPLALPYEYASASFGALNEQVAVSPTWGETQGCAVGNAACSLLQAAGVDVEPDPFVHGFTGPPLRWNLYTGLDLPIRDGGTALALPIVALAGLAFGWLWSTARGGSTFALVAYAISGPTLLFSGNQFGFVYPHILGAIAIALLLLWMWRLVSLRAARSRPRSPLPA
ncbi:MAG: hypothetical protein ACRDL6_11330 [Solirubrobacterales bacterium]